MLETGIAKWSHLIWSLNAYVHLSPEYISSRLRVLQHCWERTGNTSESAAELVQGPKRQLGTFWGKLALNSLFGIWGIKEQWRFLVQTSTHHDDSPPGKTITCLAPALMATGEISSLFGRTSH